ADKLKALGADVLEAGVADLEIADGAVRVVGTDRAIAFSELTASPKASPDRLTAQDAFTPPEATYPNGTHLVEVEVDPDSGVVAVGNYVVVDGFGVTLDPLM